MRFWAVASLACVLVVAPVPLRAAEPTAEPDADAGGPEVEPSLVFDSLTVTGGAESVEAIPGSATFIGREELERQDQSDLHRVLRQVPGVNIQEEDGFGLRPNIGMRGTGVERSAKITLMEDGVLIAPAPYSAPAAYYLPTTGRMASVEVRKGSSAIVHGPYTNGGVINLVSRGIPSGFASDVSAAWGEHEALELNAAVGRSSDRFGWLLQTFQLETDGFKDLDGGGPTGFELEDYLAKLRFASRVDAEVYQAVELKVGLTDQFGNETYLGLTRDDFADTPFRRYAASQRDYIDTEHEQLQIRYYVQPTTSFRLTATAYRNDFFRNWHKGQSVAGVGLSSVVDSPELYPSELAILRGELDDLTGAFKIRNNRRDYYGEGIDLLAEVDLTGGGVDHALQIGLRVHADEEDRFQEEDRWNMVGGLLVDEIPGAPGSQSNRISSAEATALYIRDEILFGRWSLTPGVRFEDIDFKREDFGRADPTRSGSDLSVRENRSSEILPGLGVGYQVNDAWAVFGGIHKGFAPPGPGKTVDVDNEESLNYELGFNYRERNLATRLVGFFSDYDNLLGRDTLSSGGEGTGDPFNGGEVEVFGLEAQLDYDFGRSADLSASIPVRLAYTYTSAEFRTSFETSFADWAPFVHRGDELPYIPEHQLTAAAGFVADRWETHLTLSYTNAMRSQPGQGAIPSDTAIEDRLLADLALSFRLQDHLELFARVRNLTDEAYMVARRPHGARPGLPRTAVIGIDWSIGR